MRVINLASGSDGNSTYIESENKKILLDDGLSATETVKRLEKIGVSPNEINAIIVTHEHSDHIKGVDVFSKRFNTPIIADEGVWLGLEYKLKNVSLNNRVAISGDFDFGDLSIHPIEVPHDVKCFGFAFSCDNKKISVVTDLGHITNKIALDLSGSQIVYLEANYDKKMLFDGTRYPLALKMRIDGPNGHLSNDTSAKAVEYLTKTGTRQIILSHLSKENNSPSLAYNFISDKILEQGIKEGKDIRIDVASPQIGAFFRLK